MKILFLFSFLFICTSQIIGNTGDSIIPKKDYGIGIQAAPFPIFGLSFKYCFSNQVNLNAIGRVGVDVDFLACRLIYNLKSASNYKIYASGLVGIFNDNDVKRTVFGKDESDTALGFGGGFGIEYFFDSLPEFGFNAEVDFIYIAFKEVWWQYDYESFKLIMLGIGAHYYF